MQFTEVLEMLRKEYPHVKFFSGDDAVTFPLMALGGHGVFSVASNLIPQAILNLVQAASRVDFMQARELHFQLLPFFKATFIETNPVPIKAAMQLCGMPSGGCRLPLCDLSPANDQKLKEAVHSLPPSWLK